ncbi:hypothetical protein MHYP_G00138400 [Metynnis hypsauchen]
MVNKPDDPQKRGQNMSAVWSPDPIPVAKMAWKNLEPSSQLMSFSAVPCSSIFLILFSREKRKAVYHHLSMWEKLV